MWLGTDQRIPEQATKKGIRSTKLWGCGECDRIDALNESTRMAEGKKLQAMLRRVKGVGRKGRGCGIDRVYRGSCLM